MRSRHVAPLRAFPAPAGLIGCCPRPTPDANGVRPLGLSPAAWQQAWACDVYQAWCGGPQGRPPVDGAAYCFNQSGDVFLAPTEDTIYLTTWPTLPQTGLAAVWALLWLDRVDLSTRRALRRLTTVLAPGGLLACTLTIWDAEGPDCASGHEQRRRIFTPPTWRDLVWRDLPKVGCRALGEPDWRYRGDACGDHSRATIVAVKEGW